MSDAQTTISGNLAGDPELRFTATGRPVANFTVAQNRRRRSAGGEWEDADTLFLRVNVWGDLAENVADSLMKGQRVVVSGRLEPRSFTTRDGQDRTVIELVADEVGASLRYARVKATKVTRERATDTVPDAWANAEAAVAGALGGTPTEPPF